MYTETDLRKAFKAGQHYGQSVFRNSSTNADDENDYIRSVTPKISVNELLEQKIRECEELDSEYKYGFDADSDYQYTEERNKLDAEIALLKRLL